MTDDAPVSDAFRVETGVILVYRIVDVADEIDLVRAEALATAPTSRLALEGAQSTAALEISRPPIRLALGERAIPLASGDRRGEACARVFDYGAVSIQYKIPIPQGTPLADLAVIAEELLGPTPALDAAARREAEEVAKALMGALERPHFWEGMETYLVFFTQSFEAPVPARVLLAQAPIARLLLGETSRVPLSVSETDDVVKHHFSYLEDDLAVVDWNSAYVHEPSGVADIPDLLEFATAHLLELRYYDALLDRSLAGLYDEIARVEPVLTGLFTRRYRRLQRRTAALLLELSEI